MRPRLRFLSDELIERILDEAYKLLETKGVTLHHESLPGRLAEAGCLLDADGKRVRMPREVVESPVRVMFAEVPKGTFPVRLTRADEHGTLHYALWTQAALAIVLILIPLLSIVAGLAGSEAFIALLNDLASLSLVVPYTFVALAYVRARQKGMDAPFKMARSTPVAVAIGVLVLVVSSAGYLGAGLYALQADPIDWIYVGIVYGGPVLLIGLGLLLRWWSLRAAAVRATCLFSES